MDIELQQEYLNNIGIILYENAPEVWVEVKCTFNALGLVAQPVVYAKDSDNSEFFQITTPLSISAEFADLREGMRKEEEGAWFSIEYTLFSSGKYKVKYNYEEEPEFISPEPSIMEAINELDRYPRSEEYIPDWLREKIRLAQSGD